MVLVASHMKGNVFQIPNPCSVISNLWYHHSRVATAQGKQGKQGI